MTKPVVGALLLAAGSGQRFGSDKRTALMADGRTVLATSLATWRAAFDDLRVVLRPEDSALAAAHGLPPAHCVWAADAALGMGHSLAAGARAVPGHWQAVAVGLADLPWLRPETLQAALARGTALGWPDDLLLRVRTAGRLGAGRLGAGRLGAGRLGASRPGHPVLFGRQHLPALMACHGQTGAVSLLADQAQAVQWLDVDDAGIHRDIDRLADLG